MTKKDSRTMIGKTITHYKIIEKIGEGGMGVVYKAEDVKLKRTVALKFITPQAMASAQERKRFVREAQAVASLDHPNICTLYEIDDAEGQTFIAMAYIKGLSLEQKIKSAPLKLEEALDIALQVAEGLEEAHEKGIIHRDIKSSNIIVTEKGQAKIMDFGIAKLADRTKLTKTATVMGTMAYMSPEQAFGEPADQRADIWSLGVVLYEMVTGQLPFKGEYPQVILNSILTQIPSPISSLRSGVPLQFEAVVNRCLEKDKSNRYQTAADLKADLKRLKRDMTTGKISFPTPTPAGVRPRPKLILKLVLPLGVVILALALLLLLPSTREAVKKWLEFRAIPKEKHLAILPFTLIGGSEVDQAFCDGLVENLTRKLTQLEQMERSMWVAPIRHIREWEIKSPAEARQILGVNLVASGSMKRLGDMVSLTINLVEAKNLRQLRTLDKTDHIANLFTWQEDVVIKMLEILDLEVQPQTRRLLAAGGTTIPGAYECYLKGLGYLQHSEKEENVDMAITFLTKAIEQDSSYAAAYGELGEAFWQKYKLNKNPEFAEKAQSFCKSAIQINDRLVPVHLTLGIIYKELGQYGDAIKEFKQALEINPLNYDAMIELATAYEDSSKAENAEESYKEAIKLRKNYWAAYAELGYFYYSQGRYEQAKNSFLKATELSPGNILGLNNLGGVYFKLGQNDLAGAMFEKSITIKPNANACSNLGVIYYFQGRYADAMNMNEEAIKLGKNDYINWGNLADAYQYTPGYSKKAPQAYQTAIQLAEKALLENPESAQIQSSLAVYYAKSGNQEKALAEISEALKKNPEDVEVLLKSMLVFEISNQRSQTLQALQKYVELNGPLEEVLKDPFFSGLRKDPDFQKLTRREGKPQSDSAYIKK